MRFENTTSQQMILIYITCTDFAEAQKLGDLLLTKRLAGCINIVKEMHSAYFWPAQSGTIANSNEVILLVKTLNSKFELITETIKSEHSYSNPCIYALPVIAVADDYYNWLTAEI